MLLSVVFLASRWRVEKQQAGDSMVTRHWFIYIYRQLGREDE
jgi:hypothetical protein